MLLRSFGTLIVVVTLASGCKTSSTKSAVRDTPTSQASDSEVSSSVAELTGFLERSETATSAAERTRARNDGLEFLKQLEGSGQLLEVLLAIAKVAPQTRDLPESQQRETAEMVHNFFAVELANRDRFVPWPDLHAKLLQRLAATDSLPITDALEQLSGTKFVKPGNPELLINGPASWTERERLIDGAQKSIWIFSWAFYDDLTGKDAVERLLRKKAEGLDVRVVVDGPVGLKANHAPVVDKMIAGGIETVRWNHPRLKGFGMHRKLMIIDHELASGAAIFGGMNFGDEYSHKNTTVAAIHHWRDTDMIVRGAPVKQAAELFSSAWNTFRDVGGTLASTAPLSATNAPWTPKTTVSGERFAFVDHEPSKAESQPDYLDPILLATLRMIESARTSIEISNAYFINFRPVYVALVRASARGVRVRVHTNSDASLCAEDKPLLGPIYSSLANLLERPADATAAYLEPEIYLQQQTTVHSKYMVVDETMGWVGSYNIHPRSSRYESEVAGMFHGPSQGRAVHAMFEADAAASVKVRSKADVTLPKSTMASLVESFFFDQL